MQRIVSQNLVNYFLESCLLSLTIYRNFLSDKIKRTSLKWKRCRGQTCMTLFINSLSHYPNMKQIFWTTQPTIKKFAVDKYYYKIFLCFVSFSRNFPLYNLECLLIEIMKIHASLPHITYILILYYTVNAYGISYAFTNEYWLWINVNTLNPKFYCNR